MHCICWLLFNCVWYSIVLVLAATKSYRVDVCDVIHYLVVVFFKFILSFCAHFSSQSFFHSFPLHSLSFRLNQCCDNFLDNCPVKDKFPYHFTDRCRTIDNLPAKANAGKWKINTDFNWITEHLKLIASSRPFSNRFHSFTIQQSHFDSQQFIKYYLSSNSGFHL